MSLEILKQAVDKCKNSRYWITGGYAVDAKRGRLSREHGDIDIYLHDDIDKCLRLFSTSGFKIFKKGTKYILYQSKTKIEIFELKINGEFYERRREWCIYRFPKIVFDNFQVLELNSVQIRIPSNEGLRFFGEKSNFADDNDFTQTLPYDEEIFSMIEYQEFGKKPINVKKEEIFFRD